MLELLTIIIGLCAFEVISSVDNAIVNAHVLKTMPQKYRKFFLFWGMLFAVFVVRGLLPFIIVWIANPALSPMQVFSFAWNSGPEIGEYVERSKPYLLLGGGIYLFFIALAWLFLEEKKYAFLVEGFIHRRGAWFYAISSVLLTGIVYWAVKTDPYLALSACVGVTAFFITDGFKKQAEEKEKELVSGNMSAISKLIYLEVLDASFSIDGVIGAFAFTLSVPLIILGNGLGALVVREITVRGTDTIAKLAYLKNGAMYAIGFLGAIMILESFGREYPFWLAPLNTLLLLAFFLWLSWSEIRQAGKEKKSWKNILRLKK